MNLSGQNAAASPPELDYVVELRVTIGQIMEMGTTGSRVRRFVPITGGEFAGPRLAGRVLPGGADWQALEPGGLTVVDARYVLETNDGVRIEIRNHGVRHADPAVLNRLAAGERVDPHDYYFRTTPRFVTPDGKYSWLRRSLFVGAAERFPDSVVVRVWRVL